MAMSIALFCLGVATGFGIGALLVYLHERKEDYWDLRDNDG
jgi:hypothetical protein